MKSTIKIAIVFTAIITAGTIALGQAARKPEMDIKAQVIAADRAFAKATAEKGLDGWMSFFADDAVRIAPIGGKSFVGLEAIRKLDSELHGDPNSKLVWEPTEGGGFADGKTGYTTGKAKIIEKKDGKEEVVWTGSYITMWRKDDDGKWKVILDTGAADPKK